MSLFNVLIWGAIFWVISFWTVITSRVARGDAKAEKARGRRAKNRKETICSEDTWSKCSEVIYPRMALFLLSVRSLRTLLRLGWRTPHTIKISYIAYCTMSFGPGFMVQGIHRSHYNISPLEDLFTGTPLLCTTILNNWEDYISKVTFSCRPFGLLVQSSGEHGCWLNK